VGMTEQLPFEGVKVADFSWVWVGPTTTRYLADHGATVVRVETQSPPDRMRAMGPYKDGVPGTNRSHAFADFNTSKLGLSLNLKNPAAVEVARRLIAWANVYVESFTPGTMDDLGLGYETARSLNPSIIMASTCLMGQSGPLASFAGFGSLASAAPEPLREVAVAECDTRLFEIEQSSIDRLRDRNPRLALRLLTAVFRSASLRHCQALFPALEPTGSREPLPGPDEAARRDDLS